MVFLLSVSFSCCTESFKPLQRKDINLNLCENMLQYACSLRNSLHYKMEKYLILPECIIMQHIQLIVVLIEKNILNKKPVYILTIKPWPLNVINSLLECRRATMSLSYDTEDRICINSHYQTKGDKRGCLGVEFFQ